MTFKAWLSFSALGQSLCSGVSAISLLCAGHCTGRGVPCYLVSLSPAISLNVIFLFLTVQVLTLLQDELLCM